MLIYGRTTDNRPPLTHPPLLWSSLFVLLGRLGFILSRETGIREWVLLDPWKDLRLAGRLCFGTFRTASDAQLSTTAAWILLCISLAALLALVRRVRAVEVAT